MAAVTSLRSIIQRHCHRLTCAYLLSPAICTAHQRQTVAQAHCPQGCQPSRAIHQCLAMCAGHNKWSKVKNVKGPKDAARSRMIMRLTMMIRVAVKEGGANPEFNPQLASLVEQCRNSNVPKATIESAIKVADKLKSGTSAMYEARGPGGCMLLIEVLTDNSSRTHQEVKIVLNKHGGSLCDGARHSFERKGVVVTRGEGMSPEQALELAIEAGAEDVQETEEEEGKHLLQLQFVCDSSALHAVRGALQDRGLSTLSASLEFIPCSYTPLTTEQLEVSTQLLDALGNCSDVVRVWDNIRAQD